MRIGIVVHGPNIIDSGYALKLIDLLKGYGDVKVRLGGTMGRTAVIDASLENLIIWPMLINHVAHEPIVTRRLDAEATAVPDSTKPHDGGCQPFPDAILFQSVLHPESVPPYSL